MKKIITTALLLMIFIISFGQRVGMDCEATAYKKYKDSTGSYSIKYEYDECFFSQPATWPPGEPHYQAKITVYSIDTITGISKLIGQSFYGTYVKDGCFEDVPQNHIAKAKTLPEDVTGYVGESLTDTSFSFRMDSAASIYYDTTNTSAWTIATLEPTKIETTFIFGSADVPLIKIDGSGKIYINRSLFCDCRKCRKKKGLQLVN